MGNLSALLIIAVLLACAAAPPWRACYYFMLEVHYPIACTCNSFPGCE